MDFPKFLIKSLIIFTVLLIMLYDQSMAEDDGNAGFHGAERDALLALKAKLNSPLNHNWTGLMCYMNTSNWYGIQCFNGRVTAIVLENTVITGPIKFDALFNLTELSILSFKNNSLSGKLMDFSNNQKLIEIDLSGNNFHGNIPSSLLKLMYLQSLQLQENGLIGQIPKFNQSSLKSFNVSYNNLSGAIPNTTILKSFSYSSYFGNDNLCGSPLNTPCITTSNTESTSDPDHDSKGSSPLPAIILVVNVVVLVVLVLLVITYCKKYKNLKNKVKSDHNLLETDRDETTPATTAIAVAEGLGKEVVVEGEEKGKLTLIDGNESRFELDDLLKASAEGLGKGNFGNTYKAMLVDGPTVVVKRLRDLKPLSRDEFASQVIAIADQQHANLLPFLAFYYSTEEKLLVQRFAPNGNLYNRIHGGRGTKDRIPFRWSSRLSVARSVARALEHLHLNTRSSSPSIVPHGNLKSTNVVFDENDVVLVSDYGLCSLIAVPIAAQRMVSFHSPEYKVYKKVSRKSDVWSYGCLLLELLTGKIPAHADPQGGINGVDLCHWVHRAVREEWTAEIFDMEIAAQRSANHAMVTLMQIAMKCCDKSPEKRPEISEVVREIENIKVVVDSEDEEDLSLDQSLTDESVSVSP